MSQDIDSQTDSKRPPAVCLCCGTPFDKNEHKIKGPYLTGPYVWVCEWCWNKPFLFFPDKTFYKSDTGFRQEVIESFDEGIESEKKGELVIRVTPGSRIKSEIKTIHIGQLKLDTQNVRFKHLESDLSEKEIEKIIWAELSTRTLAREIEFSQGLSNPLIIDASYVVREGNRRLMCLRKLAKRIREGELGIPLQMIEKVPCVMLPKETTEQQIALFLTLEHVTGKKEWRALNKASQIYALRNIHGLSFKEIERSIGRPAATLSNMETAYRTTLAYHRRYQDDKNWLSKYSFFYELFRIPQRRKWAKTGRNVDRFMRWIANGKIKKGVEVRNFALLVKDELEATDLAFLDNEQRRSDRELISSVEKARFLIRTIKVNRINQGEREDRIMGSLRNLQSDLESFLGSLSDEAKG